MEALGKLLDHYGGVLCVASLYGAAAYGFVYWVDENLADAAKASQGRFCRERVRDFRSAALALLAGALLARGSAAEAHPHVWVTATSELVYAADGSLTGVRHAWTFDDMFSSHALQGFETKTKGVYTREEMQPLAQTNVEALKEYAYFRFLKANGNAGRLLLRLQGRPRHSAFHAATGDACKVEDAFPRDSRPFLLHRFQDGGERPG